MLNKIIIIIIIILVSHSKSKSKNIKIIKEKEEKLKYENKKKIQKDTLIAWNKYKSAEKYLYIWEYFTPDYILQLCQDHNFTRVYLSIGCIEVYWDKYYSKYEFPGIGEIGSLDYETFIKKLNKINVEVELVTYLARDGDNFKDVNRIITVANMVKDLSKKVKIKALHFDQECADYESFENLLHMYETSNSIFPTSAILDWIWLDLEMADLGQYFIDKSYYKKFIDCETLVDALMIVTTYTDLMAYNQDYNIVREYMEKLKIISSRHPDKEAKNIIEISGRPDIPEEVTLNKRYLEDKDTFFEFIYESSKKYGGITIHYFEAWYETLYCNWPDFDIPYNGGYPEDC